MAKKQLIYNELAKEKLLKGAKLIADAIRTTLGPRGHYAILDKSYGTPQITNDGASIAKEISLPDAYENMGVQMIKEAAVKTNDLVGDGTTTATVLAYAIFKKGLKNVVSGVNPMLIKRGIEKAVKLVVEELEKKAIKVESKEQYVQIASLAANNDMAIGNILADAMDKIGKDGVITIESGNGIETETDIVEGMQFDRGYISANFVTNQENMKCELEKPYILLYDKKISSNKDIIPILQQLTTTNGRSLLIIAEDIEGDALTTLVVNKIRGNMKVCAVKAPGFGDRRKEMLEDIAILIGTKVISEDTGRKLENANLLEFGTCDKIEMDKKTTIITGGAGNKDDIDARIKQIEKQIELSTSNYDKEKLQERLAKLAGGVAVIKIGAATEFEMKERKTRANDALASLKAALESGIILGGGLALLRTRNALAKMIETLNDEEKVGANIIYKILSEPLSQLSNNADLEGAIIVQKVLETEYNIGFDINTETYINLEEAGIMDPLAVTRSALQNAASAAAMMLTTEALIADTPKEDETKLNI